MKKILMSLLTIAMVSALITGGAIAFFSDVETAPGTFTAGTIDIAVGDGNTFENPWTEEFTIALDGKPSQVWYIEFVIENVGTNPAVIWKHLTNFETSDGELYYEEIASSEPEFVAGGGEFIAGVPDLATYTAQNDIHTWILYDLFSEVILPEVLYENMDQWHQTEFDENVTLKTVWSNWIILGSLPPGGQMFVRQSYHLDYDATTNKYQGDTLTFDIKLHAQQMEGTTLLLENKAESLFAGGPAKVGFDDDDDNVLLDDPDDKWGKLTYNTVGSSFDYTFEAVGLTASTEYSLIYYADPWDAQDPTTLIAQFETDSNGDIGLTPGTIDLGMDLPSSPDGNLPLGAKIWLVKTTDLLDDAVGAIPGDSVKYQMWGNLNDNLTETHLIWYNDTDVS